MQSLRPSGDPPRSTTPVSHISVFWSEAVLRQDNVPISQGFAGKLYLMGSSNAPITAPGKFTIYAYDETGNASIADKAAHVKPDLTWELPESDLRHLMKKDSIGWSYSLWLPCGAPASTERRYTLLVCFSPEAGPRIVSESTLVTLPAMVGAPSTTLSQEQPVKVDPTKTTPRSETAVRLAEIK
jgi:hypothetical protein